MLQDLGQIAYSTNALNRLAALCAVEDPSLSTLPKVL